MEVGTRVFVHYDIPGDPTWHERLLCSQVTGMEWVVVTPDYDSFVEDLDPVSNHDITGVHGLRNAPPEVARRRYCFADLTHAATMRLLNEGELMARRERRRRGLPDLPLGVIPGPGGVPPPLWSLRSKKIEF